MSLQNSDSAYRIPLSRPRIEEVDRKAVDQVLRSLRLSGGSETRELENVASTTLGVPVVSCSSGTAGLILALRALGIESGEVITPALGFIASAHAIRAVGAQPRFCDVSNESLCCGVDELEAAWSPHVKAVMPVDLLGVPAPMVEIMEWAKSKGVAVIEDACEALGTQVDGTACGSLADAASFGFYPNKILTMGEGGLVACRDRALAERVRRFANQGRVGPGFAFSGEGYNFRLTEIQAALGRSQWSGLQQRLEDREKCARQYLDRIRSVPGVRPAPAPELTGNGQMRSWFAFVVILDQASWRDAVRQRLSEAGIETGIYFPPITDYSPYDESDRADLSVTLDFSPRMLTLPLFPDLKEEEIDEVVSELGLALDFVR